MRNLAQPFGVSMEERVHHDGAAGICQQLAAQANQPPARDAKLNPHPPVAVVMHICDFAPARAQLLHHHTHEFFRYINREMFHRFHQLAVNPLGDDLGFANHQFVTFTPHHLDQDGKLQLSASQHLERIRAAHVLHAQGNVGQQLFRQSLAQVA